MDPVDSSSLRDRVFRAIAHSGRRNLLTRLAAQPGLTLGELCHHLPMTRQAVSQHLDRLAKARLVLTRWHGREKLHYFNPIPLSEAYDSWLAPLVTREAEALVVLRDELESERGLFDFDAQDTEAKRGGRA